MGKHRGAVVALDITLADPSSWERAWASLLQAGKGGVGDGSPDAYDRLVDVTLSRLLEESRLRERARGTNLAAMILLEDGMGRLKASDSQASPPPGPQADVAVPAESKLQAHPEAAGVTATMPLSIVHAPAEKDGLTGPEIRALQLRLESALLFEAFFGEEPEKVEGVECDFLAKKMVLQAAPSALSPDGLRLHFAGQVVCTLPGPGHGLSLPICTFHGVTFYVLEAGLTTSGAPGAAWSVREGSGKKGKLPNLEFTTKTVAVDFPEGPDGKKAQMKVYTLTPAAELAEGEGESGGTAELFRPPLAALATRASGDSTLERLLKARKQERQGIGTGAGTEKGKKEKKGTAGSACKYPHLLA